MVGEALQCSCDCTLRRFLGLLLEGMEEQQSPAADGQVQHAVLHPTSDAQFP